jgi:type VI protein secretion system component VasF
VRTERHSLALAAEDPVTDDFRREIAELAKTARDEIRQQQEETAARKERKRKVHPVILVGLVLLLFEVVSLAVLAYMHRSEISAYTHAKQSKLISQDDCRAALYRTYRALVVYKKDNGRFPNELADLVSKNLLDRIPVDPASKLPLVYGSTGERFKLTCPKDTGPTAVGR